jgi:hypothetical protein
VCINGDDRDLVYENVWTSECVEERVLIKLLCARVYGFMIYDIYVTKKSICESSIVNCNNYCFVKK